jgi:tRNA nucleotidyltransferase/poly(A) polymerase
VTAAATSPREAALSIVRHLRASGQVALFAGGCVRDELLGREPDDYDVVTTATPEVIANLFRGRTSHVGAHFGVVIVRERGVMVEVATFRTDGSYTDRRRPDAVTFSTPEQDARRRDFTVNALFLDPLGTPNLPRARGEVIDHVGGIEDLRARLIRAVGDPHSRLAEDHLRALRAARLAAKLSFEVEPATAAAIRMHAGELSGVSRERIGEEVRMMLSHPSRAIAAGLMRELALEEPALHRVSPGGSGFPLLAGLAPSASLLAALPAYAIDLVAAPTAAGAAEVTAAWRTALCLSNEEQAAIRHCLASLEVLEGGFLEMAVAPQKSTAQKWMFPEALAIACLRDAVRGETLRRRLRELEAHAGGIHAPPLIDGDELIRAGLKPGPAFKKLLEAIYDAQLEGRISTINEALAMANAIRTP